MGRALSPPVFFVPGERLAAGDSVRLDGPEGRHAVAVRRLTPGEAVVLTDGRGLVVDGVIGALDGKDACAVTVRRRHEDPPPVPRLVVVQALAKGDRGEAAVEAMTEIGVDEIVPWAAARAVVQWRGDRGAKALSRWRATAREAAKQSRRTWWPEVSELASTAEVSARLRAAALPVVLHEEAARPLAHAALPAAGEVVVVVGPEGGLTAEELADFAAAGGSAYLLGPTVLRTSTAGVAAAAVLLSRTARWSAGAR